VGCKVAARVAGGLSSWFETLSSGLQEGYRQPYSRRLRAKRFFLRLRKILHPSEKGHNVLLGEKNMSSALYAVGYLLLVVAVSYLAHLSHIPDSYIFAIDVIMLGIGVVTGMENARQQQKDSHY
jgi:hypothetical protein